LSPGISKNQAFLIVTPAGRRLYWACGVENSSVMHFALVLSALFLATWRSFFTAGASLRLSFVRLGIGWRTRRGRSLVQPLSLVATGAVELVIHRQRHSFHRLALFTATLLVCAQSTGQTPTDYKKKLFTLPQRCAGPRKQQVDPKPGEVGRNALF